MPLKCSRTDSKVQHRFQMVSQNRDRAKALYKLRERSSTSLQWKGLPALNAVFEAISQFTDPNVDEVGAEANARGGPLDPDLLLQVTIADSVHPVDLIEVKDVVEWAAADSYLCRSEANCLAIQAAMQEHQINGRMLMHVLKSDLMRMGLQGPVARLLLIRIESFKAERKIGKPEPSVEKQHGTSAEFALLAPEERKYFLKNFFEFDERQVSSFCRVFEKFDAIITPAAPGQAPRDLLNTGNAIFNGYWTMLGVPAISLPLLKGKDDLPIGVQIITSWNKEAELLDISNIILSQT